MNLNQVTVPSSNIKKSVDFYKGMGFKIIVDESHYARFECPDGDSTFSVHLSDNIQQNSDIILYFETDDLDNLVLKLQKQGYVFMEEPTDQTWLWREARLKDPDGAMLCLYHAGENRKNPPWRV